MNNDKGWGPLFWIAVAFAIAMIFGYYLEAYRCDRSNDHRPGPLYQQCV